MVVRMEEKKGFHCFLNRYGKLHDITSDCKNKPFDTFPKLISSLFLLPILVKIKP